ncbi:hypothetical protein HU761_19325 [Pseudomonas sp. SWRI59]|uniref:hypothetical protein n=1 Tax=unclassified Pseudomonas TaxID=196821 RepID=UPI001648E30C|nr:MULTISPECIES: hypothetical protein [unclassified Pseudomonas]MBC3503552.1 hypothetical protein [Pseudomonas sp. SWRI59]MBC3507477.1 hypothetical protein [Pseudomonas sp. SWRI68]
MTDPDNRDKDLHAAIDEIAKSIVSLMEHCTATDNVTIEIVSMLAERALAENRVDDVRPMVKSLGRIKEKSENTLESVKKLLVALKRLESGQSNAD